MNEKKIVRYKEVKFLVEGGVNARALVLPVDHPDTDRVSNEDFAITSMVVAYDEATEVFETENTVYVPT